MLKSAADKMRDVPEVAVRLYLGAKAGSEGAEYRIELDGRVHHVGADVFEEAREVAKALTIRERNVTFASDVLELRHDAEDIYLGIIFGAEDKPQILFVPAGMTASAYLRAMVPSDVLTDSGEAIAHFTHRLDLAKALKYDILWIQLLSAAPLLKIIEEAKQRGVRIVYDVDDRLDAIPDWNQAKRVYGTEEARARFRHILGLADLVTVATKPLACAYRDLCREIQVLPNMVSASLWPPRQPADPSFTRILWAGSVSHRGDLELVAPAIKSVLAKHQGKVRFTIWGERMPEAMSDVARFIDLKAPVDYEDYADHLSMVGADFGICPLVDNEFNRAKSCLKALEFSSSGYPTLLSPVGEYTQIVESGFPSTLVADCDWEQALDRMVMRPAAERVDLGKQAQEWVIQNRCVIRSRAKEWLEVANALVARR
jgi:glycosyltransferase involved in cell wall biosynthesis